MKHTTLKALEKHLEGAAPNHLSSIYLVMSKEGFERKSASDKIAAYVLDHKAKIGENFLLFDAGDVEGEMIWEELQAFSFLAPKRVVLISQAEKMTKPTQELLRSYFANPNKTICLILEASGLNRATNLYKDAEKYGVVLDVAEEKPWEKERSLQGWIVEQLHGEGKQIDSSTAAILIKQLGTDQSTLHQELEKLICFVGDRKQITASDISAVCTKVSQESGWLLGEAIFRCDGPEALRMTKGMLEDGTALIALLRQIRSQFQTDYQVCCMLASGKTPQDISQSFPYMKGMVLNKHVQQAQAYGAERFKSGILAIDETELLAKNSAGDPDWLMERLIFKLVAK